MFDDHLRKEELDEFEINASTKRKSRNYAFGQ